MAPNNHQHDPKKQFIKLISSIGPHRHRHEVFGDFLEMVYSAVRKTTLPPGPEADALEARYMAVVEQYKRHHGEDDIRKMPELLAIAHSAIAGGGCDFLGSVAGEMELLNGNMGQFFTPYEVCRLMAEMTFTPAEHIERRGFVTLSEPACGAGALILAYADTLERAGFNPSEAMYVDAIDLSDTAFKMGYIQLSLRGIPAMVRRGNSLSLEMFENARTPALGPFLFKHREAFEAWQREPSEQFNAVTQNPQEATALEAAASEPPLKPKQLSLF